MAADWTTIKAEYITGAGSYRDLCKKYGVSYRAMADRGKAEGWGAERDRYRLKATSKIVDAVAASQADRAARLQTMADKLMDKVEHALNGKQEATPKDLRSISRTLLDIKELQDIRPDLDVKEQEARIEALRQRANPATGLEGMEYGVVMMPDIIPLTPPDEDGDGDE